MLTCRAVYMLPGWRLSPETSRHTFSHLGPSQHSLRLLQETSFGQTLAAVGSTPAGLLLLRFSKPGAHGLAADLATGGPTGPPWIRGEARTCPVACPRCMCVPGYVLDCVLRCPTPCPACPLTCPATRPANLSWIVKVALLLAHHE